VLERLAVTADGARRARGRRRESADGRGAPGPVGVVGEPGRLDVAARLQGGQDHRVELPRAQPSELLGNRPPRQVVTEGQRVVVELEDAGAQAGVDGVRRGADGLREQPELGGPRYHGCQLDDRASGVGQRRHPQRNRLAHASRHALARRRRQRLGHEERVAAGDPVQLGRVRSLLPRQLTDRGEREQRGLDPPHHVARERREHAPDVGPLAQRVLPARHDQAAARARQPPPEQREQVERRLVDPVEVLDDEGARPLGGELVEDRGQQPLARRPAVEPRRQGPADPPGDVPATARAAAA